MTTDHDRPRMATLVLTVDPQDTADQVLLHGQDGVLVRLRLTPSGMLSLGYAKNSQVLFVAAGRGIVSLLTPEGVVLVVTVQRPTSRRPRLRITAPREMRIERTRNRAAAAAAGDGDA